MYNNMIQRKLFLSVWINVGDSFTSEIHFFFQMWIILEFKTLDLQRYVDFIQIFFVKDVFSHSV